MRGLPYYFMTLAVVSILIGMGWGIQMSVTMDHSMHPAHAHLNLIGWVGFAIFAFYYHLVPAAAGTVIAKVHFALAVVGLVLIVPGIVMALNQTGGTSHMVSWARSAGAVPVAKVETAPSHS